MAHIDLHGAGVDFRYILLENYKQFRLNENQLAVLLMIDHLLRQGNKLITADLLSLKMQLKTHEIDKILTFLLSEGYIAFETTPEGMQTSLSPLKEKLYKAFELSIEKDRKNLHSEQRASALNRLYEHFEKRLNRILSPLENDTLDKWLDMGYTEQEIRDALEEALLQRKRSFKSIEKILLSGRIREDIAKEGYSGLGETWDKDIERTIEIAKAKWIDDEDL